MKEETFHFAISDKFKLNVFKWLPDSKEKAVMLLVHGSVEHAYRYRPFAEFLTSKGIAVIAPDLRGHGQTPKINGEYSFFAEKDGWNRMVKDLQELKQKTLEQHKGVPVIVFGHSMGAILVRDFIARNGDDLNGVILMGNAYGKFALARASLFILKLLLLFRKGNSPSPFFHDQLYGRFNRTLKNAKTSADFISRDKEEVQKYLDDSLCGITVTLNYAQQLARGSLLAAKKKVFKRTPPGLPIILMSGLSDPVGGKGAIEVKNLFKAYKKNGKTKIEIKLYENARHELLNDINRNEVMQDILNWINRIIK